MHGIMMAPYNNSNFTINNFKPSVTALDNKYIVATLETLYAAVFLCCFVGNLIVIFAIIKHTELRSATNFFLMNLAMADFCVGVFCVIPTMVELVTPFWVLGEAMCKIRAFIHQLSYTASVTILVCLSADRYFVVRHPLVARRQRTKFRLRLAVVFIWIFSIAYSVPYAVVYHLFSIGSVGFCLPSISEDEIKIMVTVNFVFLYVIPVGIMAVLYTGMGLKLKESVAANSDLSNGSVVRQRKSFQENQRTQKSHKRERLFVRINPGSKFCCFSFKLKNPVQVETELEEMPKDECRSSLLQSRNNSSPRPDHQWSKCNTSSHRALYARKRLIKMLSILVLNFTLCVLPYHVRLLHDHWGPKHIKYYFEQLLPQLTYIILYMNSGLDPLLYAFLSKHFRRCTMEALGRRRARSTMNTFTSQQ